MTKRIEVIKGDITKQEVDVIVNAAHEGLTGGGGVDGAIHQAAGPLMTGECMNLPVNDKGERCPVGCCRMTGGYNLPALYILHTVGPVWTKDGDQENNLIKCYLDCLRMAELQGLRSIAFPCISTGAFCYPKDKAAKVAVDFVKTWMSYGCLWDLRGGIELIKLVCFDDENYNEYLKLMPNGFEEYKEKGDK